MATPNGGTLEEGVDAIASASPLEAGYAALDGVTAATPNGGYLPIGETAPDASTGASPGSEPGYDPVVAPPDGETGASPAPPAGEDDEEEDDEALNLLFPAGLLGLFGIVILGSSGLARRRREEV